MQDIAAFRDVTEFTTIWNTRCKSPGCGYNNMQGRTTDQRVRVHLGDEGALRLEEGLTAVLAPEALQTRTCKDTDDCGYCQAGEECPIQCGQQNGENGPQLVDHGSRLLIQLVRFTVMLLR